MKAQTTFLVLFLFLLCLFNIFTWIAFPHEYLLNYLLLLGLFILSILLFFLEKKAVLNFIRSSYFKKITQNFIFFVFLFFLLSLVNYLAFKNPYFYDLSKDKTATLSLESTQVLSKLEQKIEFSILAKKEDLEAAKKHCELYRLIKPSIEIKSFDLDLRPDLAQKYQVQTSPSVLIKYNKKEVLVDELSEKVFTNALLRISREKTYKFYYTIGHNELDFESKTEEGLGVLKDKIISQGHDLEPLQLFQLDSIPKDLDLLMILGPRLDFQQEELALINKLILKGTNLVVALDPQFNGDKIIKLRSFFKKLGMTIENDIVLDQKHHASGSQGAAPIIKSFSSTHPVTNNFKGVVFFPLSSSVWASSQESIIQPLTMSSDFPNAWAESNLVSYAQKKASFNEQEDRPGPINLSALVQVDKTNAFIVGNSTFLINAYEKHGHNHKFFLRVLSHLVNNDKLLSFDPAKPNPPILISGFKLNLIFFFSVLAIPLLLILVAIYMYRKKNF